MLYWKLIIRGLSRHRKSGKKIFVLLALCSAAILFFLAFRDSFISRYQRFVVDVSTSHLQILPASSPKLSEDGNCTDHRQGLTLLTYSRELEGFLTQLPAVESAMLALETRASVFTLEGEPLGVTSPILGVDPESFERTLPGVAVLKGSRTLAWTGGPTDAPVFRPMPQLSEVVTGNDRFAMRDFRISGAAWTRFKSAAARDFPVLFPGGPESPSDTTFLADLNGALARADLASLVKGRAAEAYDYRVDDALAALDSVGLASERDSAAHARVLRKRLLQAVYPEAIAPVRDDVELDVPYTMTVPLAQGESDRPVVLPVAIAAYVQRIPLYNGSYYIDARALRARLGIGERDGTNIYIRLKPNTDLAATADVIRAWITSHGLDYVVQDHHELGRLYLSTAAAFGVITLVLVALFAATVMIFIVNTVLLSVKKRRREIGTSIALGLERRSNIRIMFGETLVLSLVSWLAGSVIGSALVLLFHGKGVPGIIFMPGGVLPLDLKPAHLLTSLVIVLLGSSLAAILPLQRLAKASPVELLKEAA